MIENVIYKTDAISIQLRHRVCDVRRTDVTVV